MFFNINSTRGHTGSLLVTTIHAPASPTNVLAYHRHVANKRNFQEATEGRWILGGM